jgi:hypothetical protein
VGSTYERGRLGEEFVEREKKIKGGQVIKEKEN